jgi:hypothetical protein
MVVARENDTGGLDLYSNLSWKVLWNGHDCGMKLCNVYLETSIHTTDCHTSNTTGEYEIFQI